MSTIVSAAETTTPVKEDAREELRARLAFVRTWRIQGMSRPAIVRELMSQWHVCRRTAYHYLEKVERSVRRATAREDRVVALQLSQLSRNGMLLTLHRQLDQVGDGDPRAALPLITKITRLLDARDRAAKSIHDLLDADEPAPAAEPDQEVLDEEADLAELPPPELTGATARGAMQTIEELKALQRHQFSTRRANGHRAEASEVDEFADEATPPPASKATHLEAEDAHQAMQRPSATPGPMARPVVNPTSPEQPSMPKGNITVPTRLLRMMDDMEQFMRSGGMHVEDPAMQRSATESPLHEMAVAQGHDEKLHPARKPSPQQEKGPEKTDPRELHKLHKTKCGPAQVGRPA